MKITLKAASLVFTASILLGSLQTAHAFATIGVIDCGTWVKQRQGKNQEATLAQIWLNGLLTGLNVMGAAQGRKDFLSHIKSTEQLYLWLDNYCRNNPMNDLALGGLALAFELSKK